MTASDRAKYQAYTKVLGDFEKTLIQKYGHQFNLLIKPAEYSKAIYLHDRVPRAKAAASCRGAKSSVWSSPGPFCAIPPS